MGNDLSFIDTDSFNQIGEYNIGYRKFTDKVCWSGVLRVTQGKKRRDAMVIVTKYRLHFFEPKTFKSPKFHTHLFDIKSIEVVNNTKILLRIYTSNKKKIKNLEFSEMNTFEMLRAIRTSIRDCTNAFPEDKILEVKDPLNATLPSSQSSLNQIQSMIESYLAVCSHENQLPSVNHIYHLQRLSLDGIYSIDFNQIPGVCDCKSPLSYNLQHAFTALGYCRSFTQIKLYEASVNRFEQALNALLRTNEYIQVLEVINCTKIDISLIADVLIESPVHVLNFHGTPLVKTNKLGYVLSKRHYNITKLDISNCGIRNLSNILVDCGKNEGLCKELIALDISENILNDEGLFALSVFLEKLADLNSKIQYLNLGELGLKIPIIMPKLKLLNLKYINISSTRFTKLDNAMELITYLQNSNSLKHICMSDMKLNTDHIVCVLSPIANNIKLENISLDLHNNNFGLDGGIELYKILPSFQNVQKLDLSGNRLKGKAMSRIITFMNDFQILNTLYIGENEMSGKELNNFFNNLIPFLQSHSNLKVLKINGIAEREDPSFIHFLEFMEKNTSLLALDIGGNHLTDAATIPLCEVLLHNATLLALNFDDNSFTTEGFLALGYAIGFNDVLSFVEYPSKMIRRITKNIHSTYILQRFHESFYTFFNQVKHNKSSNGFCDIKYFDIINAFPLELRPPQVVSDKVKPKLFPQEIIGGRKATSNEELDDKFSCFEELKNDPTHYF